MQKNERFIVNRTLLPKKDNVNYIDWWNTKEIEVYFIDDKKTYILKVEDVIKDNNINKVLLSFKGQQYKRYLQTAQIFNGNLEDLFNYYKIRGNKLRPFKLSDDGTYWIGITYNNIEFYFNGEKSKQIMKYNWRIVNGYLVATEKRQDVRLIGLYWE